MGCQGMGEFSFPSEARALKFLENTRHQTLR